MSAVLDDDVGFDEPAADEQQLTPATGDKNAVAINSDMKRVQAALGELDRIEASLPEIEARFPKDVVYACDTTKGYKDAVEHRAAYRDPRILAEKSRKMAKAPLLTLGRRVDARAGALSERLTEGEEAVDRQIKAEDARKEKEKQDRINAEAGRVLKIQEALAEIGVDVQIACTKTAADVLALLERMRTTAPDPLVFQEQIEDARAAYAAGIAKLETAHKAKLWDEEQEAERLRVEEARKARQKAEDEERAHIAAAQAAEAKRLADRQQAMDIAERAADLQSAAASAIRDALNLLELTRYPEPVAEVVQAAHDKAVAKLQQWLAEAEQREADAAELAALRAAKEAEAAEAARREAEARMAPAYEAATKRVGHDRPYEVYLRFAGDHATKVPLDKVDEYIDSLNALQPVEPEIQAPPVAPVADGSQDSDDGAANPAAKAGQRETVDAASDEEPFAKVEGETIEQPAAGASIFQEVAASPQFQRQRAEDAAAADTRPPIATGELCDWLGFTVRSDFIRGLGIEPAPLPANRKAGTFWAQADLGAIRDALVAHLHGLDVKGGAA